MRPRAEIFEQEIDGRRSYLIEFASQASRLPMWIRLVTRRKTMRIESSVNFFLAGGVAWALFFVCDDTASDETRRARTEVLASFRFLDRPEPVDRPRPGWLARAWEAIARG